MKNRKTLVAVLGILGILIATVGVTYAFYSYSRTGTKENKISSGNITFLYKEESQGITISEAMPMTDVEGKALTGSNNVFDFRVTSSVGSEMRIPYTVTVLPNTSNIPAQYVKLYLTDQSNNVIEDVRTLSSLDSYNNTVTGLTGEKVLYEGEVPAGTNNYNKLFRLRMWLADNIDMSPVETTHYLCNNVEVTQEQYNLCNEEEKSINITQSYPYNNKTISVKVNVYSNGEGTTQSEAQMRANTNIETLTVGSNNVTQVDDTHFESTVTISSNSSSTTIPIIVDTVNDNATVKIEQVDNVGAIIKNDVKLVSVTKNFVLDVGTHYFRITVTPQDKSTPTIYYLTVKISNPPSFATDTWADIQANVQRGNISYYEQDMANGVTRPITLTGDPITHYLRIANTTSCKDARATATQNGKTLTSETACGFVIEFADIIDIKKYDNTGSYGSNVGGYFGSNILYNYLTDEEDGVYAKLPIELRNIMQETIVVASHGIDDSTCDELSNNNRDEFCNYISDGELIYLLDLKEVGLSPYPSSNNSLNANTRVLDYYRTLGESKRIKVKRSSDDDIEGTANIWWTRTALANSSIGYCIVNASGGYNTTQAKMEHGVSPAFRIGPLPDDAN